MTEDLCHSHDDAETETGMRFTPARISTLAKRAGAVD
jgi:hypothetical protein